MQILYQMKSTSRKCYFVTFYNNHIRRYSMWSKHHHLRLRLK